MAKFVMQGHEEVYAAPPFPERPAAIQLDDHELIDAHRAHESGHKITADKRRALSYMGTWRVAVWAVESEAGKHLATLVDAALVFEGQDFEIEADTLFGFAEDQYAGFVRAEAPRGAVWSVLRDWCCARTRNFSLLPQYMRTMQAPKGGVPFHRPQGARGQDDVNQPQQGGLPWEE